jgi:hypothetical protein
MKREFGVVICTKLPNPYRMEVDFSEILFYYQIVLDQVQFRVLELEILSLRIIYHRVSSLYIMKLYMKLVLILCKSITKTK